MKCYPCANPRENRPTDPPCMRNRLPLIRPAITGPKYGENGPLLRAAPSYHVRSSRCDVFAKCEKSAITVFNDELAPFPRHVGEVAGKFHAPRGVLGVEG